MGIRQFTRSLHIIKQAEHVNRFGALTRHVLWQLRKWAFPSVLQIRLSRSVISDDEPGGVISQVHMLGLYDYNNMNLVQLVMQGGGVFVDVGANIGSYTVIASENPEARIVSLEPNPAAYRKLLRNIAVNMRENVRAINAGASARAGTLRMTNDGASPMNRIVDGETTTGPTLAVQVDQLDAICSAADIQPTLIKIDVEGHELDVLLGASASLQSALACIVENGDRPEIVSLLRAHGFIGPLYYQHLERCFRCLRQRLAEDPVFLSPAFGVRFPNIDIASEEHRLEEAAAA